MLPTLAAGVASLRRRRLLQGWLELGARHARIAFFAAGVAVLLARAVGGLESREAAPLLALASLSALTGLALARRKVPGAAVAAASLDVQGGARGQVVTEGELGSSAWSHAARLQLESALRALPRVEWGRALRRVLPGAAFAALAVAVPIPRAAIGPPPVLTAAAIETLEEKLETLEETLALPPETASEMEARLERIEEEAAQGRPESTFEAIDRLGERLDAEAAEALEAAQRASHDLAAAARDPRLSEAQAALESALSSMESAGLGKELPAEVREALQPGSLALPEGVQLSSAELAALSREFRGVLDERLAKLAKGRLIDPARLRELEPGELADLADFDPMHECDEECKKPGGT